MDFLIGIDYSLFQLINQKWTNAFFDFVLPPIRDKYFWIPLYAFLLLFFLLKFKQKSIPIFIFALITVALTDQASSSIIKHFFERLRPCNQPELENSIRLLVNCGPGYSFTSSHAANHFGLAAFLGGLFLPYKRWLLPLFLFWAFSISYAQVYVGVHYPFDIIGGALVGTAIGAASLLILQKVFKNPFLFVN